MNYYKPNSTPVQASPHAFLGAIFEKRVQHLPRTLFNKIMQQCVTYNRQWLRQDPWMGLQKLCAICGTRIILQHRPNGLPTMTQWKFVCGHYFDRAAKQTNNDRLLALLLGALRGKVSDTIRKRDGGKFCAFHSIPDPYNSIFTPRGDPQLVNEGQRHNSRGSTTFASVHLDTKDVFSGCAQEHSSIFTARCKFAKPGRAWYA